MKSFKKVHLYLDDLEQIESILTKELGSKKLTVSTGDYEYTSIAEVASDVLNPQELGIQASLPYANITFDKHDARVYFSSDSLEEKGAFVKISEIIQNRERRLVNFFSNVFFYPIMAFGILVATLYLPKNITKSTSYGVFMVVYVALVMFWWTPIAFFSLPRHSKIDLVKKSQKQSFLTRNWDTIIIGSIIAIIGAIVGAIATKIVSK